MKKGTRGRSLSLISLASKIGRSEIAQSIRSRLTENSEEIVKTRIDQARWIAEHLSELKGAAMKVGQLLSIDAGDYFPPEAMAILAKLQAAAEPIAFSRIQAVLIEDLGPERFQQFEKLDPNPAAAASIGQVHRAKLNGVDVALKVQYPGIAESIDSDLKILKTLVSTFTGLTGRKMDIDPLFAELKRVLEQEADYRIERGLMHEYRNLLSTDSRFLCPQPFDSHSSRRVLTMTWEHGVSIETWLRSRPSVEKRTQLAKAILDLFCLEFYAWGLVQTDPNFANFLIRSEGLSDDILVLLDFGATLRYTTEFREKYRGILRSVQQTVSTGNRSFIVSEGESFGLIDTRESLDAKNAFVDLMLVSAEPFLQSRQPFQFEDQDYARRTTEIGASFARQLRYSPPPHSILFLHRKLGGIFNLVKKLNVEIDLAPYWKNMTAISTQNI